MRSSEAGLLAGATVLAAAMLARQWGPEPPQSDIGKWYMVLRKPSYTPPGPVIGAAWATLDVLLAVAGYRLMTAPPSPARGRALASWATAVAGIPAFCAVFFGARRITAGLGVIAAMQAAVITAIAAALRVDRPAAALLAPLSAWLGFAGLLNEELWRRNVKQIGS